MLRSTSPAPVAQLDRAQAYEAGVQTSVETGQTRGLTAAKVVAIRERRAAGEKVVPLAAAFGVTNSLIAQICTGRIWKDAGGPLTRGRLIGTLADRLKARSDRSGGPDACWPWTGNVSPDGYGRLSYRGRDMQAHRMALEVSLGRELRRNEVTRHGEHCPRTCVNPAHLKPGMAKLTEAEALAIRNGGERQNFEATGRAYGITGKMVSLIVRGTRWSHLPVGGGQ